MSRDPAVHHLYTFVGCGERVCKPFSTSAKGTSRIGAEAALSLRKQSSWINNANIGQAFITSRPSLEIVHSRGRGCPLDIVWTSPLEAQALHLHEIQCIANILG